MSVRALLEPILDDGIKNTNFFEGRLLSAQDLRDQQQANLRHLCQLGRAIGGGILQGLEVGLETDGSDGKPPEVKVYRGLAINGLGQVLELAGDYLIVKLGRELKRPGDELDLGCVPPVDSRSDVFAHSGSPAAISGVPNGIGFYVLALSPAAGFQGYAPKSGLQDKGIAKGCGRRYAVEGFRFRLVAIDPASVPGVSAATRTLLQTNLLSTSGAVGIGEPARLSRLRNLVAHILLGTESVLYPTTAPLTAPTSSRPPAESLVARIAGLSSSDVPLAVVYWTLDGIAFHDNWSVRRTLGLDHAARSRWWTREEAVAEAMMLQLQEQMRTLRAEIAKDTSLASKPLDTFFHYLPPAGLIPVSNADASTGFALAGFFKGRASGIPTNLPIQQARELIGNAQGQAPIEAAKTDVVQLYWIDENLKAVRSGKSSQPYLLFTSRDLHGVREADKVVEILGKTWKSYSALMRKQVFLPKTMSQAASQLWTALDTDLQGIVQLAMIQQAAAAGRHLDRGSVLQVLGDLYGLQKGLAADLIGTFDGDDGLAQRTQYASQLTKLLDDTLSSGAPGLKPAIVADDFQAALLAQEGIADQIGKLAGEVIFGQIQLGHVNPDGTSLVPGREEPYRFDVEVTARTESQVAVGLSAAIAESQSGTWDDAVEIHDKGTGSQISSLTLNPDELRVVEIRVWAPEDAEPDEDILLRLIAALPPPTSRAWPLDIRLRTVEATVPPLDWRLEVEAETIPTGYDDAQQDQAYGFMLSTAYLYKREPKSVDATLTATFAFGNSRRSDWDIQILEAGNGEKDATGVFGYEFQVPGSPAGGKEYTKILVTPLAPKGAIPRTCTFDVAVAADVTDPSSNKTFKIEDKLDASLSLVQKAGAGTGYWWCEWLPDFFCTLTKRQAIPLICCLILILLFFTLLFRPYFPKDVVRYDPAGKLDFQHQSPRVEEQNVP